MRTSRLRLRKTVLREVSQIYEAVTIRLFPNKAQSRKLWENAGAARWIWNWGLSLNNELYAREKRVLSMYDMRREFIKMRNGSSHQWLKEISQSASVNTLRDLDRAFKSFYSRLKSRLNGGYPKFKARESCVPAFYTRSERVYIDSEGCIYLEKIGHIRCKSKDNLRNVRFYNVRVKVEAGKWLMKCAVKTEDITQKMPLRNVNIGIDLGVKVLAVISCGGHKRVFRNINRSHRMRRLNRQLKHHQRALSRKQKGSNNRLKARRKVQKIHGRLRRIRHNYIHQTTRAIVNMRPKAIVLEDLNIAGMMKNKHLAKSIAEQNLYLFRKLLERKAVNAGIRVIYADRFYPGSKTCSQCGHVKARLLLSERVYECHECGLVIDRDFNAARNLEKLAC